MSSDLTRSTSTTPALSLKNKIDLGLAGLLGLADTLILFTSLRPDPSGVRPPLAVFVVDTVLGLIPLVSVSYTWWSRSWIGGRIVAGSRILAMISALPSFFVLGVPLLVVVLAAVNVVVTVIAVRLVLSRAGRPHQIA